MQAQPTPLETDALVIGAGPAGLFAVFMLGLLDMRAHIVEALPHAGGQPATLYADKPIYDIPGLPACNGHELTSNLLRQSAPFAPQWHLGQLVQVLERQPDGRWLAQSDKGQRWLAKTVFIAAGAGAFMPRKLKLEGASALEGRSLLYTRPPAAALAGQRVVVLGGEEAAQACAAALAEEALAAQQDAPAHLTLLHRRASYQADEALTARIHALHSAGALTLAAGQIQGLDAPGGQLRALQVMGPDGSLAPLPADTLLVMQGLLPKLGPVADWHLAMENKQLAVDTTTFQTSAPGIFAIGDINTYPGKKKLILCAFHEATLAAYAAQKHAHPDHPMPLQYTTSSTRLHRLLGV